MYVLTKLASLWWLLGVYSQDQPYCSARYERLCQGKGPHVACQFPYRGIGENCENYTAIIFTNNLKKFVLHYINRRRQRIAAGHERVRGGARLPKPELMMMVQWDRELAFLAQRLADQCQFVHDDCRATVRYPYAGQTVGEVRWRRTGSLENGARRVIARVFDAWWGERRRVQPKQLISPFSLNARGAVWGHFSQLTVWTLRAMGCGAVHHGSTRPRLLLVCDFSHTNMLGQRTISPGPLAPCPTHTVRIPQSPYPLLCAPVRDVQAVKDYGHYRKKDDDEEEEESDDEEYEETTESHIKRFQTIDQDAVFSTRPWPDRPVRPLHVPTIKNRPPHLLDDSEMVEDKSLDYQNNDMVKSKSQKFGLKQEVEEDGHSRKNDQYIVQKDIDTKINKQMSKHRMNSDSHEHSVNEDSDTQKTSIERYDSYNRNQNENLESETISGKNNRLKAIINQDEFKRPVRPVQEQKTDSLKSVRYDQKPIKPLQDELIETDRRPVRPIKEFFSQNSNRPIRPIVKEKEEEEVYERESEDDIAEKEQIQTRGKDTVKTTAKDIDKDMVSVRYRDEPIGGEVRKSMDRELRLKSHNIPKEGRNRDSEAKIGEAQPDNRNSGTGARAPYIRHWDPEMKAKDPSIRNRDQDARNRRPDSRNRDPYSRNLDQDMHVDPRIKDRYETTKNRQYEERNKAVHKIGNYRHFENMRKVEYKARNGYVNDADMSHRMLNQWSDVRNRDEENLKFLPGKHGTTRDGITTVVVYRPTSLFSISTEPIIRSRFKQTRVRPNRPGANALLQSTTDLIIRRQSKASLLLDKDDEEQLYHDTGFKLSTVR